jgi:hypothetical protein
MCDSEGNVIQGGTPTPPGVGVQRHDYSHYTPEFIKTATDNKLFHTSFFRIRYIYRSH